MNLTRWNPLREMDDLFSQFGRSFGRLPALRGEGGRESMTIHDWSPSVDVSENDNEYLIKVELPGVDKKDVKVSIHEGVLTIQGERKLEREEKNRKYHRVEREYGRFARSFVLPENVDEATVSASHKEGLLNVTLGKVEQAKPRAIEVKVA
jgi:HSP20 family protein